MLRFYLSYIPEAFKLLFRGWNIYLVIIGTLATILLGVNKEIAQIISTYTGFSPFYAFVPVGTIVVWGLLRANYKRFDIVKAELDACQQAVTNRPTLTNRDALVRAISELRNAADNLLIEKRKTYELHNEQPSHGGAERVDTEQRAEELYKRAHDTLIQEKLVAGYAFREPIGDFLVCIRRQLEETSKLSPEDIAGVIDINLSAEKVVRRIDAIVSGNVEEEQ